MQNKELKNKIIISESLRQLQALLPSPVYLVGGYVRNCLLGLTATDMDIAGIATPEEVRLAIEGSVFHATEIKKDLGTIKIMHSESEEYFEYTTFRKERYLGGAHMPHSVSFTDSLKEDAMRRDFTMNAVYCNVETGEIVDPLNGTEDISKRVIRAAEPSKIFAGDGLRIMRLARFAAELDFETDNGTMACAKQFCGCLKDISEERKRVELDSILFADIKYGVEYAQYKGLKLLCDTGAMAYVIPELLEGETLSQRSDYHKYPVMEHIFQTVKYACPKVRKAALFHDIAKPKRYFESGGMAGHDKEGETLTRMIMKRLRYPKAVTEHVCRLVKLHMADLDGKMREKKVRVFIADNADIFEELMLLKQADFLGSGLFTGVCPTTEKWRQIYARMRQDGTPFTVKDLKISAMDLMTEFNVSGSIVGETLKTLRDESVKNPDLNASREKLLKEAEWLIYRQYGI